MAGWISSKLKFAEDFLHQIDQQAADSLKKNEKQRSDEDLGLETSKKPSEIKPLLKDQLKKKTVENHDNFNVVNSSINSNSNYSVSSYSRVKEGGELGNSKFSSPKENRSNLTDNDWTELLSVPSKKVVLGGNRNSNGVSGVRHERRDGRMQGSLGTGRNVVALDGKRSQKGQTRVLKSERKLDVKVENKMIGDGLENVEGKASDGGDVSRSSISSGEVLLNDDGSGERGGLDLKALNVNVVGESKDEGVKGNEVQLQVKDDLVNIDGKVELGNGVNDDARLTSATRGVDGSRVSSRISASAKGSSSSPSNEESDLETDSGSSSDSESEREREERRKRRQQILAEKAAAKAIEAIKLRENNVAKLEGEKQSLEKILEEQAKQQVLEASELQTTMMETMEAVELEKQKHNNTRMEALACLAKLETRSADLARSLASAQKNLEVETNRVSALRQQIELKEAALEELRRTISSTHHSSYNLAAASKGVELEREILEAEYSFLMDKGGRLQEKAKALETSIESTKRELEHPTEVEVELKRRLNQLTDHLIQKQAQVEALSSEKAMLLFKIEAVSRSLDEKKSMLDSADLPSTSSRGDLESGAWVLPNSKLRPLLRERLQSGKQHLGSLVQQLDSIYCAGATFLRRNSTARIWSLVYLVCLHLWVIYIFLSHSPASNEARSGAVVSLENINNTGGD
ncbi:hypothetical protein ACH5RR_024900 [Cinchona calisaya]|uniref:Golgin candidate 2 n=1 Tax=Cinchona calisaya TaxID=153742 RepID=A0ABD2YZ63_9GENT